jgi:hypothetical protein
MEYVKLKIKKNKKMGEEKEYVCPFLPPLLLSSYERLSSITFTNPVFVNLTIPSVKE